MQETEIEKEIASKFNLTVKNITPLRDAHILNTSKGKKLLRKPTLPPERIIFIHAAKEHLFKNGFTNLDRYLCAQDNYPYMIFDNNLYTITDMFEGRECNFDDSKDVMNASILLASMHKASKGFIQPPDCVSRDELGKLPKYFSKRLEDIKRLRNIAKKEGSKFDYLYLKHFDYFYNLGENSLNQLKNSRYNDLVETARKEGVFCHHDFTYHNIICSENKTYAINFDYCCFELCIYDLANFLRRKMRKCKWSHNEAKIILDKYRSINDLDRSEFDALKIILQFPQKFWRVANKYYNSKRSWSEKSYLSKLQEVIDELEYHKKFIEKFDSFF
ncbi:MAG: CotS family spore coat protein [Bacillota bacterium]|nr:CotS family spore coat protein [Bacillota bacterium]